MKLSELVDWMDAELRTSEIEDYPNAHNGLQVENVSGEVIRVAAAVDACEKVIEEAIEGGADLLIVHHGMLWSGSQRIVGPLYRKLRMAFDVDMAIYSSHLPLDLHPRLGNNSLLAQRIGLDDCSELDEVGVRGTLDMSLATLIDRVERAVSAPVHIAPGGPDQVTNVAVVTGGAGSMVKKLAAQGIDTFITGEGSHATFYEAEEARVNLIYAGHYATEVFGVKALAEEIKSRFGLDWFFVDHPSGL